MINHKYFEFIPYLCADINDVIITFRTRQPPAEKISMQSAYILCLNHDFSRK